MTKIEALKFALDCVQYEEFEEEELQIKRDETVEHLRQLIKEFQEKE